jgi:predicted secreted protein
MALERRIGRYLTLTYATVKLGGVKSLELNIDSNMIDVSDHDSGRWTNYLDGRKNIVMNFTCNYVQDDPTQLALTTAILADTTAPAAVALAPSGTPVAGDVTYSGNAFVSNVSISTPDDDVIEISGTLTFTGELTKAVTGA